MTCSLSIQDIGRQTEKPQVSTASLQLSKPDLSGALRNSIDVARSLVRETLNQSHSDTDHREPPSILLGHLFARVAVDVVRIGLATTLLGNISCQILV